jgi:multicomponent Na+:H+ antiporter subunit D
MIESPVLLIIAIFLPLIAAGFINLFSANRKLRNVTSPFFGVILCAVIVELGLRIFSGETISANLYRFLPGLNIGFKLEPLGLIFAGIVSFLWVITSVYSIGYLHKTKDQNPTRLYIFMAISIAMALGVAFSANLLVMFIFYELLTLVTYPLVTHKRDNASITAGRKYLLWLVGLSILFFLPAIIGVYHFSGTLDFTAGGIIDGGLSKTAKIILLFAFIFGIGKAAAMPFHWWLPEAMVAPTPVSALLHAVAVVKAGIFCILKIIVYIFATENLSYSYTSYISYFATITIIGASIIALKQDNIKKRLAYSTIAQLSYVILAASLISGTAITAGAMQLVGHAFAKISLFFAAGIIITSCGVKYVSGMNGVGKQAPIALVCFFICSLSLVGLPFMAGGEVKGLIERAAEVKNQDWIVYMLYLSGALNAAYFLPMSYRAFFMKGNQSKVLVPVTMNIAIVITTIMLLGFPFYEQIITRLTSGL